MTQDRPDWAHNDPEFYDRRADPLGYHRASMLSWLDVAESLYGEEVDEDDPQGLATLAQSRTASALAIGHAAALRALLALGPDRG
jgi:hypothetical protein